LNPDTQANDHLDAEDYLDLLSEHYADDKVSFGLAILDPPWSNRQASEVYGTPNLYAADSAKMVRIGRKLGNLIQPGGYVIKCGYNTNPFHPSYECVEVRLVFHGGTASDTVFSVWKNVNKTLKEWIEWNWFAFNVGVTTSTNQADPFRSVVMWWLFSGWMTMSERRPSGATHSFRLSPRACEIMDTHPEIRPGSKYHNKSAWASKAIQWFFDSPLLEKERDSETGDFTGKFRVGHQGQPRPFELELKVESLEKKLDQVTRSGEIANDEANHTPPGGGIRLILHQIRSYFL
jgi:hypothetical protein